MCAMSPRLLRPRATGYVAPDDDARAYLAAVQAADGSNLETAVSRAINDFIVGCKSDGIWSAMKASCILMGAKTLSGALTPLVGAAPTNNSFSPSTAYNRKTGLIGDGSTTWLNSNRNNNADPQNSKHLAVYRSAAASSDAGLIGSNGTTTGHSHLYTGFGSFIFRNNAASPSTLLLSTNTGAVFIGCSRSSSTGFDYRVGASGFTATVTSETPANSNIRVFETGSRTNARLSFYSIGEALDLSLLRSRVDTLVAAIAAGIP